MWQLALVYLFQWYALFCYWQNTSKSIALSVWNATPQSNPKQYEEAVGWAGLVGGWSNIMTFLSAFILVYLAKKYSAKAVEASDVKSEVQKQLQNELTHYEAGKPWREKQEMAESEDSESATMPSDTKKSKPQPKPSSPDPDRKVRRPFDD